MRKIDHSEIVAKKIVEHFRRGREMRFRENQSRGEYDFDLVCGQTVIAAVEATTLTDESIRGMRAAILDERKGGLFIDAVLCKKSWSVHPIRNANINRICANADAYLAAIEAVGLERFFAPVDAHDSPPVFDIYRDLGIEAGSVTKWKAPERRIAINFAITGGLVELSALTDGVSRVANASDNKTKLANVAPPLERHLFIYVDPAYFLLHKVLINTSNADAVAVLPNEITHIWIASETRSQDKFVVWTAKNGSQWQIASAALDLSDGG
ncbi:MAG: hypothetical protein WBW73_32045 [Rhodoplanes sp.]